MKLSPYLSFNGQCQTAFNFYEQCLGGKVEALIPYEGSPMESEVPAEWSSKVMHGEFRLDDFVVMGSDCPPGQYEAAKGTTLMLSINNPEEAEKTFEALSEDGTITMPMKSTFWAQKFGALVDQFGIPWMINCD